MAGFLFEMTVSNLLVAFLNLHRLLTVTEMRLNWRQWVLAPLAAVGLSAVGAEYLPRIAPLAALPAPLLLAAGVTLVCAMYALLLWAFGCVTREDLTTA